MSRPPTPPPQSPTPPSESEKESEEEEEDKEEQAPPPPQPTPGPSTRRSGCQPKPQYDKNSIYGKKSRSQVDKMSTREWKKVVGELSSAPKQMPKVLQKSKAPRNVPAPPSMREPSPPDEPETDEFESEGAVEEELLADSDEQISLLKMCQEGGTEAINFLLAKAVSPTVTAPTEKSPKEWSYRDLVSQTQLLLHQIKRVIHDVCDINKYIGNNKKQQSNNLSKPGDLPHKHRPNPHNDEQSEEGCKYSVSSRCEPWSQDEYDRLCNPRYHEQTPPLSPPELVPRNPEPETSHTYLGASSHSTSGSSSLADSCPSGDTSDPSSSCKSSSSKLPSEEETDSREGMDMAEEFLDLEGGGGTGMAKDCSSGEELRGDGANPIQQVQGWDLKKDL